MEQKRESNELQHHGIPGQKWGVRRYQNKDGSLTSAGRKRMAKSMMKYKLFEVKKGVKQPIKKINKIARNEKIEKTKHALKTKKQEPEKKKTMKDMTNEELREKTTRLRLENDYTREVNNYNTLHPKKISNGRKFISYVGSNVIKPAATDAGKSLLTDLLKKVGNEQLGLKEQHVDKNAALKKEVETLELERRKMKATDDIYNMKKKKENKK